MNSSALKYFRAVAVASLLTFSAVTTSAQLPQTPGKLDLSYANTGYKFETWSNGAPIQGTDIQVQPDGKVLAGVTSQTFAGAISFTLRRYNPDGSRDLTFDADGQVQTDFPVSGSSTAEIRSIALQPDGKILAGGYSITAPAGASPTFTIVRYHPDGALDTSFGVAGRSVTDFNVNCQGNQMAIAPDGKIILAGFQSRFNNIGIFAIMVARYNSDGTVDTTFGTNGYMTTTFLNSNTVVTGLQIQPDGKVIVAGNTLTGNHFGMVRLNGDGTLDNSFGTGGTVTTVIGTDTSNIMSIRLLADGRILAGGTAWNGPNTDFALARYNTDGSLDTSFDGDGMVLTPVSANNDVLREIVVQSNGKIVAGGHSNNGSNNDFSFVRWNSDGSVDTTFGTNGKTIVTGGTVESASGLALDPLDRATFAGRLNNGIVTGRLRSENQPLVTVGGRLMSVSGNPIANVQVVMEDENLNTRFVLSNGFGYYTFTDVPEGATYTISMSSKRFTFSPPSQTVGLTGGAVSNIDFVGTPYEPGRGAPVKKGGKQILK